MLWFEKLMGFREENPDQVRKNIQFDGKTIISKINNNRYHCGILEIPALGALRGQVSKMDNPGKRKLSVQEVIGDVRNLHLKKDNAHALFQAASQFNLLEMASPHVTPEAGVGIYAYDRTQGPACAIACGAGTIVRNYFVEINGRTGQTAEHQIDCLSALGKYFGNEGSQLWKMQNGYAFATERGLELISRRIKALSKEEYEELKGLLKVGIQWDTEVTISDKKHRVSQIYCSALPVGYSSIAQEKWRDFAKLILDATYEATLLAALINSRTRGDNRVYLTLVGGGVFANKSAWIIESIVKNLKQYQSVGLDVKFISYKTSNQIVNEIIDRYENES